MTINLKRFFVIFDHCDHRYDNFYLESGKIGIVIMKDMTRWGRDYLQVGNAMEIFRRNNVRFIAINNGIDSQDQNTLEFAPFINIMSEWYARDISKKAQPKEWSEGTTEGSFARCAKPPSVVRPRCGYFCIRSRTTL